MAGDLGLTGADLAREARKLAGMDIPYKPGGESLKGMDCQGLVEYVIRFLGGKARWKGSNAMYRSCVWRGTPEQCRQQFGQIPLGACTFIWKDDGGERERGYMDGLGNAVHVGIYLGDRCVHASNSRGRVCFSDFAGRSIPGGWNRVGLLPGIDYLGKGGREMAEVFSENGRGVRMRVRPSETSAVIRKLDVGTEVEVLEDLGIWLHIRAQGQDGYMMADFVRESGNMDLEDRIAALEKRLDMLERRMKN